MTHSPLDDAVADDAAAVTKGRVGPLSTAAAIVFGLFYAYALFAAVSQLIDLPHAYADAHVDVIPWGLPVAGLFVPILVFAAAFWLGLRRNVGYKALIYVAGLAAVAALSFSIIGFENYALAQAVAAL